MDLCSRATVSETPWKSKYPEKFWCGTQRIFHRVLVPYFFEIFWCNCSTTTTHFWVSHVKVKLMQLLVLPRAKIHKLPASPKCTQYLMVLHVVNALKFKEKATWSFKQCNILWKSFNKLASHNELNEFCIYFSNLRQIFRKTRREVYVLNAMQTHKQRCPSGWVELYDLLSFSWISKFPTGKSCISKY